jgi:preprotein translocase subunit SecY
MNFKIFSVFRLAVGVLLVALGAWWAYGGARELAAALTAAPGGAGLATALLRIVGGVLVVGFYYYCLWADSPVRRSLENIFSIPELLRKLAFTLGLLCIYRIGFHVPLPGVNLTQVEAWIAQQSHGAFGQVISYYSILTGGGVQFTLFSMGIMPYISASIIFQLLATVVPSLEKLQKEGPAGHKKIQEYTRYATVGLAAIQAVFWVRLIRDHDLIYPQYNTMFFYVAGLLGLTAGTIFLMWLGEQIDEYGIGNGISLLIMAGIVARLPVAIHQLGTNMEWSLTSSGGGRLGPLHLLFLTASFVLVVAGAILITQGQRRIPIQQAKQMRGRRVYGGQRQYLPLRVNHGGVMPIIFAQSLMMFPSMIFNVMKSWWPGSGLVANLAEEFARTGYVYTIVYIAMIFFFAYFWTTVQFRPKEMSDQLRDYGSFIPGLRPGRRTAEYLERVMERITYCGAAFLSVIAVLPQLVNESAGIPYSASAYLGGTGLLIMVSVTLDLVQRIEANLVMRNYGGFLGGTARIKGAYA